MCHRLLADARFPTLLLRFDLDLAAKVRAGGCEECGGRLDSAPYPRKPRGAMCELPGEYATRLSFCCAVEGCRSRHTPPSLRFLGRRVYLGAVVVLATAMQQGPTPERSRRLRELIGISPETLARWRAWWLGAFAASPFWKAAKALFSPPIDNDGLPRAALDRFRGDEGERLVALLRLIEPLTTSARYLGDRPF